MTGPSTESDKLESYRMRLFALREKLDHVDFILKGSILERYQTCGKPGCRCQAAPPTLHGPYYQWTRKVKGKTVTAWLKKEDAMILSKWIQNGREFHRLVSEMEKVTLKAAKLIRNKAH